MFYQTIKKQMDDLKRRSATMSNQPQVKENLSLYFPKATFDCEGCRLNGKPSEKNVYKDFAMSDGRYAYCKECVK